MDPSLEPPRLEVQTPIQPKGWITIRICQLILCVCTISLNVFVITTYQLSYGNYIPVGTYVIFCCSIVTLGTTLWLLASRSWATSSSRFTPVLVIDGILCVFWLISFILEAVAAAARGTEIVITAFLATSAALGAIQCVLSVASTVTESMAFSRYRRQHLQGSRATYQPCVSNPMAQVVNTYQTQSPVDGKPGLKTLSAQPAPLNSLAYKHAAYDQYELGCNNPQTPELPVQPVVYEVGSCINAHDQGGRLQQQ
ncbi:hypothetical protein QQS21_011206 [Conoideocrella luteorostrata]|uniref:MARVEL domain-containing protein n=1 Tax=Conoideocrella luteorostrata TaxID=1105319 RepID=A0AAJ0FTY8_9HYPO|nr:hypothetical protein QQS21_011206 [Conoideocrella luteorostrata]